MSDKDILDRVKKVTTEKLTVKDEEITEASSFMDDLGADSIEVVEIAMALESEFGIEISDDDVQALKTVGDACEYIKKHVPA